MKGKKALARQRVPQLSSLNAVDRRVGSVYLGDKLKGDEEKHLKGGRICDGKSCERASNEFQFTAFARSEMGNSVGRGDSGDFQGYSGGERSLPNGGEAYLRFLQCVCFVV